VFLALEFAIDSLTQHYNRRYCGGSIRRGSALQSGSETPCRAQLSVSEPPPHHPLTDTNQPGAAAISPLS
jgi:hypothetical protein